MASDSDSDSESAAMAAAMGFSSFGGKPAAKKRKFNPTTDAFVEGRALEKLDRGGKKGTGSGGNMIPLGKTRVIGQKKVVENHEEINLDEDDEKDANGSWDGDRDGYLSNAAMRGSGEELDSSEGEGPQYINTSRTPPAAEDDGPQYIDTSEPAPAMHPAYGAPIHTETSEPAPVIADPVSEAEAQEMQRRIDAILESIGSAPPPPSNDIEAPPPPGKASYSLPPNMPPPPPGQDLPNRGIPAFGAGSANTAFMQGGSRGGFASGGGGRGARSEAGSSWGGNSRGGNRAGHGNSGRGGRNEKWYLGYYDATFNVNPWEALEKQRGLEPVGSWLEYPQNQDRGGQRG
ncbi:hypothetical protein ONS95_005651 [Cadophora gregata]|uniref:uncharacterized protein n=1 Tax=Cadophora gregata TaxID=51156 RepID=UPI0026DB94FC|nr:uncharacterized protein ONS95_005651 [Cadophora gregata]KAK0103639.1 hypothetical protein ONS95_005651 [Cadophora gregata]KAK0107835.1 hypothetical protein ONS96_003623 [Cadophora gregata f. sp. sojae]